MKREDIDLVFKTVFANGVPIRGVPTYKKGLMGLFNKTQDGEIIGRGVFEKDLERVGFDKRGLKQLVKEGILQRVTTQYQGGWRTTYVLPADGKGKV